MGAALVFWILERVNPNTHTSQIFQEVLANISLPTPKNEK
jgi:hypothetical protein